MNNFEVKTKLLEENDLIYFNRENFETKADKQGLEEYTNNILYKYAKDKKKEIENTKEISKKRNQICGMYDTINGTKFFVPRVVTTNDEIKYIEILTKMINYKTHSDTVKYGISTEVIPTFNVYDYLIKYHKNLEQLYLLYKRSVAIRNAKEANIEKKRMNMPLIYSYLLLEERKENYNIDELNKINATVDNEEKALVLKNYKI